MRKITKKSMTRMKMITGKEGNIQSYNFDFSVFVVADLFGMVFFLDVIFGMMNS